MTNLIKVAALLALATEVVATRNPQTLQEVNIGEDVSFDGANVSGQNSGAAITVDTLGTVTVRIGAAFPLLKVDDGSYVRLKKVKVLR
jgi:hypothetical protein